MPKKKTADAVDILHQRYFEGKPQHLAELEEARASAEVARQIHELRTQAGLTQRELAKLAGTSHSVISRLEDDDYKGHSYFNPTGSCPGAARVRRESRAPSPR